MIWFVTLYLLPVLIMIWALLRDCASDITLQDLLAAMFLIFMPVVNLILAWHVLWVLWGEIPWNTVVIKRSDND